MQPLPIIFRLNGEEDLIFGLLVKLTTLYYIIIILGVAYVSNE